MSLGTVLVTGGCGCIGFNVVRCLLEAPSCTAVHVVSRSPKNNRLPNVVYHAGDITSIESIRSLLLQIQPRVIIHAAAPVAAFNDSSEALFHEVIVGGTNNLLQVAAETKSVQAFVHTSSHVVMLGPSFVSAKEDWPMLSESSTADFYEKAKYLADIAVLAANDRSRLRTVSLRIGNVYGERDNQMIPAALRALQEGHHIYQFGDNSALSDFCSATNSAKAHVLAAKALLNGITDAGDSKVDGEAFFINDGQPMPIWDFMRKVWAAAGDRTPLSKVTVIPAWLVMMVALTVEWTYYIFTLGQKRPKFFKRQSIEYITQPRTFSIDKARDRLGFIPNADRDEVIARAVDWELNRKDKVQ